MTGIFVVNFKGQLLCSKRSNNLQASPGKWQACFGGHVRADQSFEKNAIEELKEEIGIKIWSEDLHLIDDEKENPDWKHIGKRYVYLLKDPNFKFKFNDGEIAEVRWYDLDEYWREQSKNPELWRASKCSLEEQQKIKEYLKKDE